MIIQEAFYSKVFQSKFTKVLLMKSSSSLPMLIKPPKISKKLELLILSKKHTFHPVERYLPSARFTVHGPMVRKKLTEFF